MGTPDRLEGEQPIPTEAVLVTMFGGLYANRLLYRKLWEFTEMTDEKYERMLKTEEDLHALAAKTLPRIQSGEIRGITVLASPTEKTFNLGILNGRLKINLQTSVIETVFPGIRGMIPTYKPQVPKP